MPPSDNTVVRKNEHLTNARAKELTADGIRDAARNVGRDKLAKACDSEVRTVEKWIAEGSLPDIDRLLNMADVDPTVLRPILAEKGWILTPARSRAANDMELAAGLGHGLSELIDRIRDGRRCHTDTAVLATLFRELVPQMQAIVDEDDARKAAA